MAQSPLTYYRLWCGRKCYTPWLKVSRDEIFAIAVEHGLAYEWPVDGSISFGPLAWIETGTRQYARSRTIPEPRIADYGEPGY